MASKVLSLVLIGLAIIVASEALPNKTRQARGFFDQQDNRYNDDRQDQWRPSVSESSSSNSNFRYLSQFDPMQPQRDPGAIRIRLERNFTYVFPWENRIPKESYFGYIGLGNPAKIFKVVFDTATEGVWVPTYYSLLSRIVADNLHYATGYECGDSRDCIDLNLGKKYINYKGTEMNGHAYEDLIHMYEDEFSEAHVNYELAFKHDFLSVEFADNEQFRWVPYDGVVGLAPSSRSQQGLSNILYSLDRFSNQNNPMQLQNDPRYGFQRMNRLLFGLSFNPDRKSSFGGQLVLGGVDNDAFVGDPRLHPILDPYKWVLRLSAVLMGNQPVSCQGGCRVQLDTNANSLVGPRMDIELIHSRLGASFVRGPDEYFVECERVSQMEPIAFQIDNQPYVLYPDHYVKQISYKGRPVCYVAIKPWDNEHWLLGTTFLSAYYTIFDISEGHVGFATPARQW